ncbi:hypothetical protein ACJX0J_030793, partial [Zea mays]
MEFVSDWGVAALYGLEVTDIGLAELAANPLNSFIFNLDILLDLSQQGFMRLHAVIFLETIVWAEKYDCDFSWILLQITFSTTLKSVIQMICGISITLPVAGVQLDQ